MLEEKIDNISSSKETNERITEEDKDNKINTVKKLISNKSEEPLVFQTNEGTNFYVRTLGNVRVKDEILGYIMVTEQANEILTAVTERRNFILRTVLRIAIAIFIFSIFLNRHILKPIAGLVAYTESIKSKDESMGKIENFYIEVMSWAFSRSLNNMTKICSKELKLQKIPQQI